MSKGKLVRRATLDDIQPFVELGMRFYDEEGGRKASPKALAGFALSHVLDPTRVYLAAGEPIAACLCGMIAPHYLTGEPTAFKTAWLRSPAREAMALICFAPSRRGRTRWAPGA